jgi:methionyl aminopeptidase
MVFTVEPMINAGGYTAKTLPDKWTVCTADGSLSAQFEHTLAVTDGAPELLTLL